MAETENDGQVGAAEIHGTSWSIIPSARSSQTVRRQAEQTVAIDDLEENLSRKIHDLNDEYTRNTHKLPVGVSSRVVARGSIKLLDEDEKFASASVMGSLPHPSKLRKRKQRRSKTLRNTRHSQFGFDVMAHVAQLKRKHAEFNWLPPYPRIDITSPSSIVDEEPFPPGSIGPQCVPSTPTLSNDFYELQSVNLEWPWELPALHNGETQVLDYQQICTRPWCIPSYAVARRERRQEELGDEECHINFQNTNFPAFSMASRSEQSSMGTWFSSPQSLQEYPCFQVASPLKEE